MKLKVHRAYFKTPVNHHGTEFTGTTAIHEEKMKGVQMVYDTEIQALVVTSPMLKAMKGEKPKYLMLPIADVHHMLVESDGK